MEIDGKLILGAFGACMGMCLLFAGGGVAIGAGIASFFTSGDGINATSMVFIASVVLFLLSAFLFLKRNNTQTMCRPDVKEKKVKD